MQVSSNPGTGLYTTFTINIGTLTTIPVGGSIYVPLPPRAVAEIILAINCFSLRALLKGIQKP